MFTSILIPVDLSEIDIARPALRAASELANSDAKLRLMTVETALLAGLMEYVPVDFDQIQRGRSRTLLEDLAAQAGLPQQNLSYSVVTGGVYVEILAEADHFGADLIIIGSHRPNMAAYLLGSNAKTIVRHAKCSVLVIRS
jgi:nucleotide-binding universal stress UspA family protein